MPNHLADAIIRLRDGCFLLSLAETLDTMLPGGAAWMNQRLDTQEEDISPILQAFREMLHGVSVRDAKM